MTTPEASTCNSSDRRRVTPGYSTFLWSLHAHGTNKCGKLALAACSNTTSYAQQRSHGTKLQLHNAPNHARWTCAAQYTGRLVLSCPGMCCTSSYTCAGTPPSANSTQGGCNKQNGRLWCGTQRQQHPPLANSATHIAGRPPRTKLHMCPSTGSTAMQQR